MELNSPISYGKTHSLDMLSFHRYTSVITVYDGNL